MRDRNGYRLRFAGSGSEKAAGALPAELRIEPRLPTWPEMEALIRAVGWARGNTPEAPRVLKAAIFGAVAVVEGQTVGCAFLTSDHAGFYYVRDVMVHPDWQRRGIGTALMRAVVEHLRTLGDEEAQVGLFTGPHLHPFYAQFGFRGPKSGRYGMARELQKR